MSGGLLCQATLREISRADFPNAAHAPIASVLERGLFSAALPDFLYAAGRDVGLATEEIIARSVPILLIYCAGNLTDDIVDGDDTYSGDRRLNPAWECLLLTHAFSLLAASPLERTDIAEATTAVARASAHLGTELATTRWTDTSYREVADGIAGLQFAALLRLLWGSRRQNAAEIGRGVGIVIHVAEDIRSSDPRLTSLDPPHYAAVLAWAGQRAEFLLAQGLPSLDAVVARCRVQFEAA